MGSLSCIQNTYVHSILEGCRYLYENVTEMSGNGIKTAERVLTDKCKYFAEICVLN